MLREHMGMDQQIILIQALSFSHSTATLKQLSVSFSINMQSLSAVGTDVLQRRADSSLLSSKATPDDYFAFAKIASADHKARDVKQ
jgi:hypothetical protein